MPVAYGYSDPGCIRPNNEDYYRIDPDLGLFLLADGMGGAQAGEHASRLAVDTVAEFIEHQPSPSLETLQAAFHEANRRVAELSRSDPSMEGMGTTLLAALNVNGDTHVLSVGDSRAYLCEDGHLRMVTEDQTWVNEVGRRLGIAEANLKTHPMRHVLTMAVGISGNLRMNHKTVRLAPGTLLLMCSDGLHGVVDEATLTAALNSGQTFEVICHYLVEAAKTAGGPDNITVILLGPDSQ